jgi:hypothetical protein
VCEGATLPFCLPILNLLLERIEIPLHLVYTHAQQLDQIKTARMLVQDWSEVAFEHHVVTNGHVILSAGNDYAEQTQRRCTPTGDAVFFFA